LKGDSDYDQKRKDGVLLSKERHLVKGMSQKFREWGGPETLV